jgi:diguanylate cyclase (GGDEF)-like protein
MAKERPLVLVVDDIEADNAIVRELVALYNYEVLAVNDSQGALRLLQEAEIDAMLVSIELPEGGFHLVQTIRELPHFENIPLAFMTKTEYDYALLMEAQFYGGMFIISKPYHDVELLTLLSSMLRIKFLQDELKAHLHELDRLASTDPLTGLFNRRLLFIRLEQELARARRIGSELCLAYLDIDHFKKINDTYGHLTGDEVLKKLSEIMNGMLRKSDVLARMGGEEFLIMLPDTGLDGAQLISERLRQRIQESEFLFGGAKIPVTISLGILHVPASMTDPPDELLRRADEALYVSKHEGRNRLTIWGGEVVSK